MEGAASEAGQPSAGSWGPPPFPCGLRVLVVDDDPTCLMIVGGMLRKCNYEVTTSVNGLNALSLLRSQPNHFDLVLSDVVMPDMDGFKLLEHIGLELNLPVIMMSANGETSTVLRGVTHGAVDFLIKPVRIEELRNVWQHVVRRRRTGSAQGVEGGGEEEEEEPSHHRKAEEKRSFAEKRQRSGDSDGEGGNAKKARVVWSVEMHQQFVNAVNTLGVDKAVPKRILDLMNVEGLTRENVASHLQKYRLYLKRVQGVQPGGRNAGGSDVRSMTQPLDAEPAVSTPQHSLFEQDTGAERRQVQQLHGLQMSAIGMPPPASGGTSGAPALGAGSGLLGAPGGMPPLLSGAHDGTGVGGTLGAPGLSAPGLGGGGADLGGGLSGGLSYGAMPPDGSDPGLGLTYGPPPGGLGHMPLGGGSGLVGGVLGGSGLGSGLEYGAAPGLNSVGGYGAGNLDYASMYGATGGSAGPMGGYGAVNTNFGALQDPYIGSGVGGAQTGLHGGAMLGSAAGSAAGPAAYLHTEHQQQPGSYYGGMSASGGLSGTPGHVYGGSQRPQQQSSLGGASELVGMGGGFAQQEQPATDNMDDILNMFLKEEN